MVTINNETVRPDTLGQRESYAEIIEIVKKYFKNFREVINANYEAENLLGVQSNETGGIFLQTPSGEIVMKRRMIRNNERSIPTSIIQNQAEISARIADTLYIEVNDEVFRITEDKKSEDPNQTSSYDQVVLEGIYHLLGISVEESVLMEGGSKKISRFVPGKNLDTLDPQSLEYQYAIQELGKRLILEHILGNVSFGIESLGNYRLGIDGQIYQNNLSQISDFYSEMEYEWTLQMYQVNDLNPSRIFATAKNLFRLTDAQILKQILEIIQKQEEILDYLDSTYIDGLSPDASRRISKIKYVIYQRIEKLKEYLPTILSRSREMQMVLVSDITREYISSLSETDIKGNSELRETLISNIIKREAEANQYFVEAARKRGITVEEFKRMLQERVESSVRESNLFTCVNEGVLEQILLQGRFKTVFETKISGGNSSLLTRSEIERKLFGLPYYSEKDESTILLRPVYGYMSNNRYGGISEGGNSDNAETVRQYGNIVVKLRQQVRDKATCAFGDTLGTKIDPAPSPVNRPHFTSLTNAGIGSSRVRKLETSDVSTYSSISRVENNPRYTEVQFHNGLLASDIEEIILPVNMDENSKKRIKNMIEKYNLSNPKSVIIVIER